MGALLNVSVQLKTVECCSCHMLFAVPEFFDRQCHEKGHGQSFYCPLGHCQSYTKSEVQKLQEKLTAAEAQTAEARREAALEMERRWAAERKQKAAEKKLRRVEKGTCPECKRHFVNVERHMATKHLAKETP